MPKLYPVTIRFVENSHEGIWSCYFNKKLMGTHTSLYQLIKSALLFPLSKDISDIAWTIYIQYDTGKKTLLKIKTNIKSITDFIDQISKFNEFKTELNHLISK